MILTGIDDVISTHTGLLFYAVQFTKLKASAYSDTELSVV